MVVFDVSPATAAWSCGSVATFTTFPEGAGSAGAGRAAAASSALVGASTLNVSKTAQRARTTPHMRDAAAIPIPRDEPTGYAAAGCLRLFSTYMREQPSPRDPPSLHIRNSPNKSTL